MDRGGSLMLREPDYIAGTTGNFWHAAEADRYDDDDGVARSLCGRTTLVDYHADGTPVAATFDVELLGGPEDPPWTSQPVECLSCRRIMERNRRAVEEGGQ